MGVFSKIWRRRSRNFFKFQKVEEGGLDLLNFSGGRGVWEGVRRGVPLRGLGGDGCIMHMYA